MDGSLQILLCNVLFNIFLGPVSEIITIVGIYFGDSLSSKVRMMGLMRLHGRYLQ